MIPKKSCFTHGNVINTEQFLLHDSLLSHGVHPGVHHVHLFCQNKCKHIFGIFSPSGSHTIQVFLYQTSWQYSDGNPLTGASNAGEVGTNRDSGWIAGYWLMTAVVCDPQVRLSTVQFIAQAVMHKWMNLCLSQPAACMTTTKRREENRIYLYSAVNLKRNLHSAFCTTEVWVLTDTKHRVAPLR